MYENHIENVRTAFILDWKSMHEYLVRIENATGKDIRNKYDCGGKAEVHNCDADEDKDKEVCRHFVTTDKCKFGDDCRYDHPKWAEAHHKRNKGRSNKGDTSHKGKDRNSDSGDRKNKDKKKIC